MRRREFITLLGGATVAWPLAAHGQQPAMPVIGFLGAGAREPLRQQIAAFLEGLKESGYVDGQNVTVKNRFVEGRFDQFPALASDLVRSGVAALFASNAGALAAKQATTTIPIILKPADLPVAQNEEPNCTRLGRGSRRSGI
jgi:putative tryptophan/tyrosine transport system substrate-binding protein